MIPQGTGWQHLRSLALDTIPSGSKVYHTNATPLHEWRSRGAFSVTSCTKTQIILEAAGVEIGMALLSDAEYFLDHVAEHRAYVHDVVVGGAWHSPAWLAVTTYYWAFFSVLALTRLTGRSAWFLDRQSLTELRTLAGGKDQPGAGALYLTVQPFSTATTRTAMLKRSNSQLHEVVWALAQNVIANVFTHTDQGVNSAEYRLWWSLKQTGDLLGASWASKLRNAVNYRAGYGYREVVKNTEIDIARYMKQRTPATFNSLLDEYESEVIRLTTPTAAGDHMKEISRLLCLYAFMMTALVTGLHSEILDRQSGDPRWRDLRSRFFAERCPSASRAIWPFSD